MELGAELGSSVAGVYLGDFWGGGCAVGLRGWWGSVPGFDGGYFEGGEWVGWVEDLGVGRDGDGEEYD